MIQLANDVFVTPEEVVSVEREVVHECRSSFPSDGHYVKTFDGSRVILKNGKKIYINKIMPMEILIKLGIKPITDIHEKIEHMKFTGRI